MAIYPQPTPTASFPQLRLVNDHQLRKPGYVNVRQSHLIHHSMLEHYDRLFPEYFRLTDESFAIVAKRFEIEPVAAKLQRLALEVEQLQSQLEACETRHGPSQPVQQTTILTRPTENGIKEFQPSRKPPERPVNKAPLQILVLVALLGAVWTFRQNSLREIIDSCNGGFAAILRLVGSALKCMTNGLTSTIGLLLRDDDGMIQAML